MRRRKTNEQFLIDLQKVHGDEYTPLEEYKTAKTPLLVKHNVCGNIWTTTADNLLSGRGCQICGYTRAAKTRRKTQEAFEKEVYNLVKDEYSILQEYKGAKTKVLFKHNAVNCKHSFKMTPSHFLSGRRCPECANKNKGSYHKHTKKYIQSDLNRRFNNEFLVLSDYRNVHEPMKIKHNVENCGYIFEKSYHNFIRDGGGNCPKCQGRIRNRTTEMFKEEVFELVRDEYIVLGEFINTKTYIKMKHNECGHEWEIEPTAFLQGSRCPACNMSNGELAIQSYLLKNNINFLSEYKFDDCKNEKPLPFDFAIFDKQKNLKLLIEFEGQQHFEPVEFFGGQEKLEYVQYNDEIKRNYCSVNNIKLLEIPYWDMDNIESILDKEI